MNRVLVHAWALLLLGSLATASAQDELDALLADQPEKSEAQEQKEPAKDEPEAKEEERADEAGAEQAGSADEAASGASDESAPSAGTPPETVPVADAAAPQAPPRRALIEEIVVTAQKREENLQDVPISISAMSREDIEERQITSIGDIASQIAGFEFGEAAGAGQVSIRGVGFGLVSGTGENSVAIHSDGVYLPRPAAINMMYEDLGGLEVLRGPQGTLYGRNATAGVLNLITIAPPESLELEASGTLGAFDQRRVKLSGGTGLLGGRLRVRASGLSDETRDGYFVNIDDPARDMGARALTTGRISADFDASEALSFKLRLFRADDETAAPHFEAYRPPPDNSIASPGTYTDDPYTHRNNDAGLVDAGLTLVSLNVGYEIDPAWSVTSLTGQSRFRNALTPGNDGDGTSRDLITTERRASDRTTTQELLLRFLGDKLQWLSGGYYLQEQYDPLADSTADAASLGGLPGVPGLSTSDQVRIYFDAHETTKSFALFTDATWQALDALAVYGGLRYTDERKQQILTIKDTDTVTGQGVTQCENDLTELNKKATTGRLGVQYNWPWLADFMTYLQAARGFKAGGFAFAGCDNAFEPEKLDAWEVGLKSTLLDGQVRLNGAAYIYDYTDLQVEEIVLPNVFVNSADAKINGAELEALYVPWESLELSLHAAYLDAVYTKFENADNAESPTAPSEDLAGNRLNRSPEWAYGGALDYRVPFEALGRVALRLDATYKSDYFLREFNRETDKQPAHAIYNAFVTYDFPGDAFTLRTYVKNLTDEPVIGGLLGVSGYKAASFNPPRLWGLGLDYRFGK